LCLQKNAEIARKKPAKGLSIYAAFHISQLAKQENNLLIFSSISFSSAESNS